MIGGRRERLLVRRYAWWRARGYLHEEAMEEVYRGMEEYSYLMLEELIIGTYTVEQIREEKLNFQ